MGCSASAALHPMLLLLNLADAFQGGACNMASSLAACLHSVGFEMPRVHDVVSLLDVDGAVEALTAHCAKHRVWQSVLSSCSPHPGDSSCSYEQWFKP